jgi:hypothetical protein
MGHMVLVAEEIVKLFENYPQEIYSVVEPHIPQPRWDRYVSTTLRETRERDLSPLGGGISIVPHDTASMTSALSDEDDEFPMNSARVMRAMQAGGYAGGGAVTDEGAFGGHGKASSNTDAGEPGSSDQARLFSTCSLSFARLRFFSSSSQFSRYLANAISSDRPDRFGSSDEDDDDDDDAGWIGGSDPGDGDFALTASNSTAKRFGFDDRFESPGRQVFRSGSPDSDDVSVLRFLFLV